MAQQCETLNTAAAGAEYMIGVGARLKFLKSALATRRWSFFKWFWLALGAYDLVLSQLVPKSLSDSFPKTYEALTTVSSHISWQAWAIGGVAIAMMASIEYSFRRVGTGEAVIGPEVAGDPLPAKGEPKAEPHAPLDDVRRVKLIEPLRKASISERNPSDSIVEAQASAVIRSSIAVLPFKNISGDPEQDFLGDGLAADLIAGISRIRNFFVIAHSSTSQYRGTSLDVRQVAKDLNVRYVIEGSVRKSNDRLRLTVLLIDGETGHCLWTDSYDERFVDIMDVQDELTKAVVGQLMPELDRAEYERAQSQKPEGVNVWKLLHMGNSAYRRMTPNDLIEARRLYEEAITLEPNFAPAHARLSIALWNFALTTDGSDEIYNLSFASAQRAIKLDDRDSLSHVAMARAYFGRRQFDEAIHQVRVAIKLNPSFAQAYQDLGMYLMHSGHAEEAISFIETAIALSPRDPLIGAFYARLSQCNLYLERLEEAVEWGKKARQESRVWTSLTPLISALGHLGRVEEARPIIDQFKQIRPEASISYVERQIPTVRPYLDYYLEGLRKAGLPDGS